jgi:hypothetical protein
MYDVNYSMITIKKIENNKALRIIVGVLSIAFAALQLYLMINEG